MAARFTIDTTDPVKVLPVVKPKAPAKKKAATRVRRPKERPDFYRTENTGTLIKDLPLDQVQVIGSGGYGPTGLEICPYTKYVPISYLRFAPQNYTQRTARDIASLLQKHNSDMTQMESKDAVRGIERTMLLRIMDNAISSGSKQYNLMYPANRDQVNKNIRSYVQLDGIGNLSHQTYDNAMEMLPTRFRNGLMTHCSMRSYSALMGFLSAFVGQSPYITAVTTRENYRYHRMRTLMGQPIDLNNVIILVDRRLDLPGEDDIPPAFKALYQKQLEPIILSTPCRIWKVPLDYITENCFINNWVVKAKNITERKEKQADFIELFYERNRPNRAATISVDLMGATTWTPAGPNYAQYEETERQRERDRQMQEQAAIREQQRLRAEDVEAQMRRAEADEAMLRLAATRMNSDEEAAVAEAIRFMTSTGGA